MIVEKLQNLCNRAMTLSKSSDGSSNDTSSMAVPHMALLHDDVKRLTTSAALSRSIRIVIDER
jgi:hypothetical protein